MKERGWSYCRQFTFLIENVVQRLIVGYQWIFQAKTYSKNLWRAPIYCKSFVVQLWIILLCLGERLWYECDWTCYTIDFMRPKSAYSNSASITVMLMRLVTLGYIESELGCWLFHSRVSGKLLRILTTKRIFYLFVRTGAMDKFLMRHLVWSDCNTRWDPKTLLHQLFE